MSDLVELSATNLHPTTNAVVASCKSSEVAPGRAPDYGDVTMAMGLGFAARPAPPDERGAAQAVVLDDVPGSDGICVGGFDPRSSDSYKELGPGETAVFSTGKGYDSRLLLKDQTVALIVGDDVAVVIDRKNKRTTISGYGLHWEQSEANGTVLTDETGTASIQLKGGQVILTGLVMLGGRIPVGPVMAQVNGAPAPAPGIFAGK